MANNKTDVPRCKVCGKYMEKQQEARRMVTYECCGMTRSKVKPEFRPKPPDRQVRRGGHR